MLLLGDSQRRVIIICTDVNGCRESHLCLQTNQHMAASVDSRAPPVQVSFSVGLHDGPLESDLDHPIDKLYSTFFARHGRRKNESLSSSTLPFRPTLVLDRRQHARVENVAVSFEAESPCTAAQRRTALRREGASLLEAFSGPTTLDPKDSLSKH